MDELIMLVQLAGGESEAASRLRAAGFRGAKDLARADAEEIAAKGGLRAAAARRLVQAAQERVAPAAGSEIRRLRNGLRDRAELARGRSSGGVARAPAAGTPSQASSGSGPLRPVKGSAARIDQGVSRAETSALTGEPAHEERARQSFWRFG